MSYAYNCAEPADGEILSVNVVEPFFKNEGKPRDLNAVWVGKGKDTNHPAVAGAVRITLKYPTTRQAMADLLNRVDTLYTYDNYSMIISEGHKCGCKVLVINGDKLEPYVGEDDTWLEETEQLKQFIDRCYYMTVR